jgi:nucleolar protein 4
LRKKPRQQPQVSKPQDPLAIRTIIISGLPSSIDSKLLWKKIRKCIGAEELEWPISGDDGVQDPSSGTYDNVSPENLGIKPHIAYAVFSTPALALDAVNKLHAHIFKGALLSVTLKKRIETLSSQKTSTKAPSHANRLIVRNLPFTATEQDLRSIFLHYGPIYSINVPFQTSPNSNGSKEMVKTEEEQAQSNTAPKLNKGFAFIWFYSRKDAEKAMEGINGTVVHAGAAEELVKGKQKKKKEKRLERKFAAAQKEKERREEEDDAEGDENGEREDEIHKSERVVAVDWALSKDRWEEEKAKMEEELQSEGEEGGSGSESESEDAEGGGLGIHDEESNESGSGESEDERGEDDKPVKPQLPQTDVGTTLFIRNVSYDATEDELRTL